MLDEPQAQRLARAICADILLYNEAAKRAPQEQRAALLAAPVQEGRELFLSRVPPTLQHLFDQAVDELIARPHGVELRALSSASKPVVGAPAPRIGAPVAESSSAAPLIIVGVVILLAIAGALAFVLFLSSLPD